MIGDEGEPAFILAVLLICLAAAAIKQHGGDVKPRSDGDPYDDPPSVDVDFSLLRFYRDEVDVSTTVNMWELQRRASKVYGSGKVWRSQEEGWLTDWLRERGFVVVFASTRETSTVANR